MGVGQGAEGHGAGRHVRATGTADARPSRWCEAIRDGELWNLPVTLVPHPHDVHRFVDDALAARSAGTQLAYATIDLATRRIAGSTRFTAINLPNRRLEIGFTFLGRTWQRTAVNTEAKLLMLTHAFEALGMNRVEFLTDVRNSASRAAISRLGATHEGSCGAMLRTCGSVPGRHAEGVPSRMIP
ncbi:GNAT family N-acetyltransferase [Streptomyces sp. NPDC050448]|uniref:GNAT family N-acetyltransferase n=1 Tax=Streptomyces sp. NPDC050448 TaxID=3155404 RepID=UPI003444FCF4